MRPVSRHGLRPSGVRCVELVRQYSIKTVADAKWMERNLVSQCLASCVPWSWWEKSLGRVKVHSIAIARLKIQHALAICSRFAVFDGHYDSDAPPGWRATKVRLPHSDC